MIVNATTHSVLETRLLQKRRLRTLGRTSVAALRDMIGVDLICDFVAGLPIPYASCCEVCSQSAKTYCKCSRCH